jgi:hypothetical protein
MHDLTNNPHAQTHSPPARNWHTISLLGAVALILLLVLKYLDGNDIFRMTHWLFAWQDLGFVKRGLVGTLAALLDRDGSISAAEIIYASLVLTALFAGTLLLLCAPLFTDPRRRLGAMLACVVLTSPGIGHMLSELGRFDLINYTLACLVTVFVLHYRRFPPVVFLLAATLMLLIHEAALLTSIPVLFIVFLYLNTDIEQLDLKSLLRFSLRYLPAVLLVFFLIMLLGRSSMALGDLVGLLESRTDFEIDVQSAHVLVREFASNLEQVVIGGQTIEDAVPEGFSAGLQDLQVGQFIIVTPMSLAQWFYSLLVFSLLGIAVNPATRRFVLLATSAGYLSAVPLFFVGIDWVRWAALMAVNSGLLTLVFARELEYRMPAERKPALAGPIVSISLLVCVFNISYAHMISRINEKVWFCEPATPTAAIADIYRSFSGSTPAWQDFLGNRQICKDSNRPDDS